MSTEAGKHTGSGGHQDNYSMEDRASKWKVEKDMDPDVQQAVSPGRSNACSREFEHREYIITLFQPLLSLCILKPS